MKRRVSLFEFMPYGAPELIEGSRPHMARALTVGSALWLALFDMAQAIVSALPKPKPVPNPIPFTGHSRSSPYLRTASRVRNEDAAAGSPQGGQGRHSARAAGGSSAGR